MSAKAVTPAPSDEGQTGKSIKLETTRVKLAETVGERIKWARERKDITQKELARLAGKSRASVVQYEQNKIAAPLEVIETLAEKLDVSPEFLAFGRSGISGVKNAEEEVEILEELTDGGSKLIVTGGWAVPRSMFSDYDHRRKTLKAVCIGNDEPNFNISRGDRVVIDTQATVSKDGLYVVQTPFGARVVRVSIGFSSNSGLRITSGTDGGEESVDPKSLDLVGMIVGVFRRTF